MPQKIHRVEDECSSCAWFGKPLAVTCVDVKEPNRSEYPKQPKNQGGSSCI
jgi:hypothetical protein